MTVGSEEEVKGLKEIGKIVALTIQEMKKSAKPGMTTKELDEIGGEILTRHGAMSAPIKAYNFPGHTCISVNTEVAHGIPGKRVLKPGDLVNVDVCAEKNGFVADSGQSFQLAPHDTKITALCRYTQETMMKVISSLKHGVKINTIGKMFEKAAEQGGYTVIQNLCSHGVGRAVHEEPSILPIYNRLDKRILKEGMVITIEPFLSTGADYAVQQADGWTLCTPDGSIAAQFEHTIIITKQEPIIVTVA